MDELTIALRARSDKEAVNLGYMVARRYFLPLTYAMLPGWTALTALAAVVWWYSSSPFLALMLVWWAKPLYERPALLRLSQLIFQRPGGGWRDQRALFAKGWLAELLWRRFACGTRITRHSLTLLEQLHGAPLRKRMRLLHFRVSAAGRSSALFLSLFESVAVFTLIVFMPGLPEISSERIALMTVDTQSISVQLGWLFALIAVLLMVVSLFSAVFFVSIGFMLYLNGRVISEGWALALDLRNLAARLKNVMLVLCMAVMLWPPQPVWALSDAQVQADKAAVQALINDPDLSPYQHKSVRQPAEPHSANDGMSIAEGVRLLLIALAAVVVIILIWLVLQRYGSRWHDGRATAEARAQAHISRQQQNTPLGKAQDYMAQGNMVAVLAALYQQFSIAARANGLDEVADGESDEAYARRAAAALNATQQAFLSTLLNLWRSAAFGHQDIPPAQVQDLLRDFPRLWR